MSVSPDKFNKDRSLSKYTSKYYDHQGRSRSKDKKPEYERRSIEHDDTHNKSYIKKEYSNKTHYKEYKSRKDWDFARSKPSTSSSRSPREGHHRQEHIRQKNAYNDKPIVHSHSIFERYRDYST